MTQYTEQTIISLKTLTFEQAGCWGRPGRAARSRCPRCKGARSGPPGTAAASPPPGRRPFGGPARSSLPRPCVLGGEHSTPNGTVPKFCGMRQGTAGQGEKRPKRGRAACSAQVGRREAGRKGGREGGTERRREGKSATAGGAIGAARDADAP